MPQAVIGRDHRPGPPLGRCDHCLGVLLDDLLVLAGLGQLRGRAAKLLAHDGDLVLQQVRLPLRLGELRLQILIVLIERRRAALQFLISLGRRRLLLLERP